MQCHEVRDLADSFLSEQLLVETNHEVLRHLEGCPACRAELAMQRELRAAIGRAFLHAESLRPSDEFRNRAVSRLRAAARSKTSRGRPLRLWAIGLAAAAALLIAFAMGHFLRARSIKLLAQQAVGDHQNCAVQFRLAEKPISLEEAAERYDPQFRLLLDTPSNDWNTPAGAVHVLDRHSCVFQGRRFAHVVLQFQGQIVSLLVTEADHRTAADQAPTVDDLPSDQGVRVVSFDLPGHIAFLVSNVEEQQLHRIAASLSAPLYSRFGGG